MSFDILMSEGFYSICITTNHKYAATSPFSSKLDSTKNLTLVNQIFCVVSFDINLIFEPTESSNQSTNWNCPQLFILKLQEYRSNLIIAKYVLISKTPCTIRFKRQYFDPMSDEISKYLYTTN